MSRIERQARVEELQQWMQEQQDEFGSDPFPPEVQRMWDNPTGELVRHQQILDQGAARDRDMIEGLRSGRYATESGDRPVRDRSADPKLHPSVRAARDQGLRAIERCVDQGARNEDTTRIEKVIREEDTPTAYGARWLAACGNPDYRSAFLTLVADPTIGSAFTLRSAGPRPVSLPQGSALCGAVHAGASFLSAG
jgi:hypothetical protein